MSSDIDAEITTTSKLRQPLWPSFVAFLTLFAWYAVTAARGLMFFDTAELAQVAMEGGVSHAPGQAVYMMVASAWARLFGRFDCALYGLNLLSALTMALCAFPIDALMRRFCNVRPGFRYLSLLLLGSLSPVWDQATRIEVYAPASLMLLVTLASACALLGEGRAPSGEPQSQQRCWALKWLLLGALCGVTAGFNAIFGVVAAIAIALGAQAAIWRPAGLGAKLSSVLQALIFAAVGGCAVTAAGFLWLKHCAATEGAFVWGEWDTWSHFLFYVTGGDYQHTRAASEAAATASGRIAVWADHAQSWFLWLFEQGGAVTLLLGLLGLTFVAKARLYAWPVMLLGAVFAFENPVFYPQIPDYNGYMTPGMMLASVGLAALLGGIDARLGGAGEGSQRKPLGAVLGFIVVAALFANECIGDRPLHQRTRAHVTGASRIAEAYADPLPEGSIFIVESDHLVFAAGYLHRVQKRWPSIILINKGFAGTSWYWRYLKGIYPIPEFELKAPTTPIRLRRMIDLMPGRRVFVESPILAFQMGFRPCPMAFGFEAVPPQSLCREPHPLERFESLMRALWHEGTGRDLIGHHVLAFEAMNKARGLWDLGDSNGALWALSQGVGPDLQLPLPALPPLKDPPQWPECEALIGDEICNRAAGAWILKTLGKEREAEMWLEGM